MPGYYKQPELTARRLSMVGALGCLGYIDQDGFLYSSTAGKIDHLWRHKRLSQRYRRDHSAQCVGARSGSLWGSQRKVGETPVAASSSRYQGISAKKDCASGSTSVLTEHQRVSAVVFMEDFPRSTAGKTLKREMREPYWAGRAARI